MSQFVLGVVVGVALIVLWANWSTSREGRRCLNCARWLTKQERTAGTLCLGCRAQLERQLAPLMGDEVTPPQERLH